jgi:hypothetical protein
LFPTTDSSEKYLPTYMYIHTLGDYIVIPEKSRKVRFSCSYNDGGGSFLVLQEITKMKLSQAYTCLSSGPNHLI